MERRAIANSMVELKEQPLRQELQEEEKLPIQARFSDEMHPPLIPP